MFEGSNPHAIALDSREHHMKPFTEIEAALEFVKSFRGCAGELLLPIDDSLQDPVGMNMALIVDHLLGREWEPAGYEQMSGYRVYRYKEWSR
jgi:hypothetical protein